jgi:uncharacterized protein YbjT (DUF2867 family)
MQTILVTGTSGYIASRLIPRLLEAGYRVRCMTRQPEHLRQRSWFSQVEMVAADMARPETLPPALQGIHAAYYLVHSMAAGRGYHRLDLQAARNFAQAAKNAGVEHIIYLGGLADERQELALHLKSRIESGAALREAGVPVTEFRAGVIVGPGSASFEMIRFMAEQFPMMPGPLWLRHKSQPIAAQNVLDYLIAALTTPASRGKIIEIGGRDVMTYAETMTRFAEVRGLKRPMLLLPFIPVWFMAFFIDKLTPVPGAYALPLVDGLKNDSLVLDYQAPRLFPTIKLLDYTEAVRRCLADLHPDNVERVWLDRGKDMLYIKHEGMLIHYQRVSSAASAASVFAALCRANGKEDEPLREGAIINSYRVEIIRENFLRLRAKSNIPGQEWVEWKITPREHGCVLEQTAFFAPKGLPGFLYGGLLHLSQRAMFKRLAKKLG